MTRAQLGALNYINSLPFFYPIEQGLVSCPADINYHPPRANNHLLRQGSLDAALVSATEYLQQRDLYTLFDDLCIGAKKQVMSVCLYTRLPVTKLSGVTVGLTDHSAASVKLLRVLCHHFWQVEPTFERFQKINECPQYDAFLLIGDACLENPGFSGYATIDLAHAWYRETQLPFTFALFAARRPAPSIHDALKKSLLWSKAHPEQIVEEAARKTHLPRDLLIQYFNTLQYTLTSEMRQGLETFNNLLITLDPSTSKIRDFSLPKTRILKVDGYKACPGTQ